MSRHTPGPWKIRDDEELGHNVIEAGGIVIEADGIGRIAVLCQHDGGDEEWDQDTANARLILAAPDLFEACRDARAIVSRMFLLLDDMGIGDDPAVNAFRKRLERVINKAGGFAS